MSGSGKTTLVNNLNILFPDIYKKLTTYTSRNKRGLEKQGEDYNFVSEEVITSENGFILIRKRAEGIYGVLQTDINISLQKKLLTTFPPKGILLLESLGYKAINFFLDRSMENRVAGMRRRGDSEVDINNRICVDEKESSFDAIKTTLPNHQLYVLNGDQDEQKVAEDFHSIAKTF